MRYGKRRGMTRMTKAKVYFSKEISPELVVKMYEKLGIDYPLKDTPPMDKTILLDKKKAIIDGIKARRAELEKA